MNVLEFKPLGPGSTVYVVAERVTHFYEYDANGYYGSRLVLDTGKEVSVGEYPQDVARKLASVAAAAGGAH